MPHIDGGIRTAIAGKSVIALLARSDGDVDRGLAALAAAQILCREFKRVAFQGEKRGCTIALVDIAKAPAPAKKILSGGAGGFAMSRSNRRLKQHVPCA